MAEEKIFEKALVAYVKAKGGIALKQTSQFHRGIPDRLILLPGGRVEWVELKSINKKPTAIQRHTQQQLKDLGHKVFTISSSQELNDYLQTL